MKAMTRRIVTVALSVLTAVGLAVGAAAVASGGEGPDKAKRTANARAEALANSHNGDGRAWSDDVWDEKIKDVLQGRPLPSAAKWSTKLFPRGTAAPASASEIVCTSAWKGRVSGHRVMVYAGTTATSRTPTLWVLDSDGTSDRSLTRWYRGDPGAGSFKLISVSDNGIATIAPDAGAAFQYDLATGRKT